MSEQEKKQNTVAEVLVKCLENEGVKYVFGIPGEENLDMMNALEKSDIRVIVVRHEQGAAFMADMYGRLTGKAGVCFSTLGPGATNLTTGIAVAHGRGVILCTAEKMGVPIYEYTPMQVKQAVVGYGLAEKKQVMDMTRRLLKLNAVPRPDDAADALAIAICHARSATSLLRRKDPNVKETV